ncbi:MAG: rhodanese-like domain-containing protein [Acidobacteria bacterium]|nr:rhodanese-like domain-containing protein [Acidobacteriota bacterium]
MAATAAGRRCVYNERKDLMVATIIREELRQKIEQGDKFQLVETLPQTAYDHAHVPGAINVPPDQIRELAAKLLPDKSADIVVYCSSPT